MKKLITICLVASLMLISTSVSWAFLMVTPPPGAPGWWNEECDYYAYGKWAGTITPDSIDVSPAPGMTFWASNFLIYTDFKASVVGTTVSIDLKNGEREDLYKEIFILIQGTSSDENPTVANETFDVGGQIFTGDKGFDSEGSNTWGYLVNGEIHHQPDFVTLSFDVTGLTGITGLWAGENCIPEPATICLLGIGALSLIRRKK